MKNKLTICLFSTTVVLLLFYSCQKPVPLKTLTPHLPQTPYTYWTQMTGNTPGDNALTDNGATLGRLLFYDPRLSVNNTVSCASCHKQEKAFADDVTFSDGFEGLKTRRNTPGIINVATKSSFFWDGRAQLLEQMVLMPVQHSVEMGMEKMNVLPQKIAAISYYPDLFTKAFGTPEITNDRISKAMAQFLRAMGSFQTPFETGQLSPLQQEGQNLFTASGCANCHSGMNFGGAPLFGGYFENPEALNAANIGLDVEYADKGIGELNGKAEANGAFIIPSLRNLKYTGPYMHDGRYQTLREVIDHYNSGIKPSAALDHNLVDPATGTPVMMNFTEHDKVALEAFLLSLSEPSITTDVRFSNPFK